MKNLSHKIFWLFIILCIILLIPIISKSIESFESSKTANRTENSFALGYLGVPGPSTYKPSKY